MINLGILLTSIINMYYKDQEAQEIAQNHAPAIVLIVYLLVSFIILSVHQIVEFISFVKTIIRPHNNRVISEHQETEENLKNETEGEIKIL